jgi:hypothetical protein
MKEILRAFTRSLKSLTQRGILWHMVWPMLAALTIWLIAGIAGWSAAVQTVMGGIERWSWARDWLGASEMGALAVAVLVKLMLALLLVPLIYVTAALLVAIFALPLMLERVARVDYADLELRRGGTNFGSAWNAIVATLLFVLGLLVSLPLWLLPGAGLLVSVLLTAWLNQKAFAYDALMLHADREELRRLPRKLRAPMLGVGVGCALLAYIPLVNFFAPAFCGLAFVHFLLDALRAERAESGWTVVPAPHE